MRRARCYNTPHKNEDGGWDLVATFQCRDRRRKWKRRRVKGMAKALEKFVNKGRL